MDSMSISPCLYQDKQLAILDAYGREKILTGKRKGSGGLSSQYSACRTELKSMDMDEEQRNREIAFLEFEIKEIEKANLSTWRGRGTGSTYTGK